jgi:hypothetical protein
MRQRPIAGATEAQRFMAVIGILYLCYFPDGQPRVGANRRPSLVCKIGVEL